MKFLVILLIFEILAVTYARRDVPPAPAFKGHFPSERQRLKVADKIAHWKKGQKTNPWEMSGLNQGDIMEADEYALRSGMEHAGARWPGAIVPYFIQKGAFNNHERKQIFAAFNEYHRRTCIRFRPYKQGDRTYVMITGQRAGCWSYVGRVSNSRKPGQQLNLQKPGCVNRGIIIHELMHALGFFHQHSASNRDRYVKIMWQNISPNNRKDFNKQRTTSFNVGYDYNSIMHYSPYAFSINRQPTIVPKDRRAKIGQRSGLSNKDVLKLKRMYRCK